MASTVSSRGQKQNQNKNTDVSPFHLSNNYHPGIAIVTAPLTGNNYLTWSTSIQIPLGAKDKLGFIDDTIERTSEPSSEFQKWRKVDFVVRSWILGSLSKELAETFFYCSTTKILQEELKERFGEGNGPQVYKFQREISSIQQGNNNLAGYFNHYKKKNNYSDSFYPTLVAVQTVTRKYSGG